MTSKRFWYLGLMLTTEIQQDTHNGPVTLNPRWLRIPAAVKYAGLSRSRLYELLSEGKIRSICLKSHKGAERGCETSGQGVNRHIHVGFADQSGLKMKKLGR